MKRIKNIGLAVVAALALSAVLGAAGASASELLTEKASTTVSASSGSQKWTAAFGGVALCGAPGSETTLGSTHTAQLETAPKDQYCTGGWLGSQLKMNGCSFVYRFGAHTSASTFKGTIDIACPEGKTVEFTDGPGYNGYRCQITIPAQSGIAVSYQNLGSGNERTVQVEVASSTIKHSQVGGYYCNGSWGTYTNGKWEGSWTLKGSYSGSQTGVYVGTNPISISGATPKLGAGSYPATINGSQGTQHVIAAQAGNAKCTTANLATSASGPTAQFSVTGEYSGCSAFGFPATIKMNGCTYTANVLNQAPVGSTYAGHADIACPAGKVIEVLAISAGNPKCTVTIPAQTTDSGGLSFTNEAATSTIGLGLSIGGIDYHQQEGNGVGRCTTGDFTTGTYTGTSTLVGSY